MLANTVTVRLNNVDRTTFLSPLYHLFVSAVAGVVPATEDSVFVVGVLDDHEVVNRHILNVSFAVRRRVDRLGKDIFYPGQFLREKVYLQRALLTKLSTLEVWRNSNIFVQFSSVVKDPSGEHNRMRLFCDNCNYCVHHVVRS